MEGGKERGNMAMNKETNQSCSLSFGERSVITLLSLLYMYLCMNRRRFAVHWGQSCLLSQSLLMGNKKDTHLCCNDWVFLEKLLWSSSYLDRSLYSHRLEKCETQKHVFVRLGETSDSSFILTIWVAILCHESCCCSRARSVKVLTSGWLLLSWEVC